MGIFVIPSTGRGNVDVGLDGNGGGNTLGLITPRVDAVWVTPEQMQMLFRASNGNVLAQCKKNSFGMTMALTCTICGHDKPGGQYGINAVAQICAVNMVAGPMKDFLDKHKHPIVEETNLPNAYPKAKTEAVTRRIKEYDASRD